MEGIDEAAGMTRRALLVVFVAAFGLFVLSPVRQNYDSYLAMPTAHAVVHDRTLALDGFGSPRIQERYGTVRVDGHLYNTYPWATSLFLVPAVVVIDVAGGMGIGPGSRALIEDNRMDLVQVFVGSLIAASVVLLVLRLVEERLDPAAPRRRAVLLAIGAGLVLGTSLWSTVSRAVWQHGPSLLCLAGVTILLQRIELGRTPRRGSEARRAAAVGALLAAAYAVRPTNAAFVVVFSAFVLLRHRRLLGGYLIGAAAVGGPWCLVNLWQFGSLLPRYFDGRVLEVDGRYPEALAANLVSPSRGLLVASPIVLLAGFGLWSAARRSIPAGLLPLDRVLAAAVVVQLLVVSAHADNWWAGHSYGPRFMTDSLVFLAALATPTVSTLLAARAEGRPTLARIGGAAVALGLGWSVLVHSQGALVRSTSCWNGQPDIDEHPERVWDWGDAQFLAGVTHLRSGASLRDTVLDDCTP